MLFLTKGILNLSFIIIAMQWIKKQCTIVAIKQSIPGSRNIDPRGGPKMEIANMSIVAIVRY